jgi:chromosome segregation ATPase
MEVSKLIQRSLTVVALAGFVSLGAWAQGRGGSTSLSDVQNDKQDIKNDKADLKSDRKDIRQDRKDIKSDDAEIQSLRDKVEADRKQFGPNSAQVKADRQNLAKALKDPAARTARMSIKTAKTPARMKERSEAIAGICGTTAVRKQHRWC